MGTLDAAVRGAARTALALFGKEVTYRYLDTGAYDSATDSAPQVYDDVTVHAVREPYKSRFGEVLSGDVREGDRKVTIAAAELEAAAAALTRARSEPEPGDLLVMDGATWQVIHVDRQDATDEAAIYAIHVRK